MEISRFSPVYYDYCKNHNLMPTEDGHKEWLENQIVNKEGKKIRHRRVLEVSLDELFILDEDSTKQLLREAGFDLDKEITRKQNEVTGAVIYIQDAIITDKEA